MKKCLFCWRDLLSFDTLYQAFTLRPRYTLCAACQGELMRMDTKQAGCLRCGKQLPVSGICLDCQYWEARANIIVQQQAVFHYNDFIVDVLWQIKHNRDIHLIRAFYPAIKRVLKEGYDFSTTLFIPIPTDITSLCQRRFNLIEFVFHELKLHLHICSLFKMAETKTMKQHKLSKMQRLSAARQRYAVDEVKRKMLDMRGWEKIVIVDDVYTSGATMIKAMKSLPTPLQKPCSSFTLFR